MDDPAALEKMLDDWMAGRNVHLEGRPDLFLFPKMLLVTGPLHQAWNAYKTAVQSRASWTDFKELLSAFLSLLGHKGLRQRFMESCMPKSDTSPEERAVFYNWPYSVVDWKWGYMESAFARLAASVDIFFRVFDLNKFKTPSGHAPTDFNAIDPKNAEHLEKAKPYALKISAQMEAHSVLSRAVGQGARWFKTKKIKNE